MNKKNIPVEFVYQLFALIIAIIIVHAFYVSVVRPTAAQVIEEIDVTRKESIDRLVADLQGKELDLLINNAGVLKDDVLDSLDIDSRSINWNPR